MIKKYYYYSPAHIQHRKLNIALRLILFTGLLLAAVGLLTIKTIYAFFSDMSVSSNNTFTTASSFDNETSPPLEEEPIPNPDTVTFSLDSTRSAVFVDEEFSVDVSVDSNNLSLTAMQTHINFPTDNLELLSITPTSYLPNELGGSPQIENVAGTAIFARGANPLSPKIGQGKIATLRFKAEIPTSSPILITFETNTTQAAVTESTENAAGLLIPESILLLNKVVINEVSSFGDNQTEWVELYNPNPTTINVGGWTIRDSNNSIDTFPAGLSVPGNGYGVVITNNSTVIGVPATATTITVPTATIGNGLTNTGDAVLLKTSDNFEIDGMSYGNVSTVFTTPPIAPVVNHTLKRQPNGIDTNATSDWVTTSGNSIGSTN